MTQNFFSIAAVPQAKDLIDIAFSKTNRKTPTVVRSTYQIHRIRSFYVRKVRFSAGEFTSRLAGIVAQFPVLEDIHPFYSDLIGILYDRDHYKIALGQVNATKHKVEQICKEYVKLVSFGDSLYRCKELKRAALGKMATTVKKLGESLKYLEEVRQHMSRLPVIEPSGRTVVLCGFPNVGKSSFMNCVSKANVEVQSYAFTTRSIFVGHFEYKDLRWQVLDTPGILDRHLEERNTVEMLTVTALAHLKAAVLFMIDVSESCGFSVDEQISLYENLTPLLQSRILIVLSKSDVKSFSSAVLRNAPDDCSGDGSNGKNVWDSEAYSRLSAFLDGKAWIEMSVEQSYNVESVKNTICEMLLETRLSEKLQRVDDFINRIRPVPMPGPAAGRDEEPKFGRSPFSGMNECEAYFCDEKYDVVPEIYCGKNVADFVDPDIRHRYQEVEREIGSAELREYDLLSREEKELLEACNNARIQANMHAHFIKRASMPPRWKNTVTSRGEIVADIRSAVPVLKKEKQHVDKKVARSDNRTYYDMQPKHVFRPVSRKHGKLKRN